VTKATEHKETKCHSDSCRADHDRNSPEIDLGSPLTIRGVTLPNRIVMSPMCQYCCEDGFADDWHLVHLGSRAVGGAGLIFCEATAITAQGRISPGDLGLWSDAHIEPLARIVKFLQRMGCVAGIQLAHAGRKASCLPPWEGRGRLIPVKDGGWKVIGPSPLPFTPGDPEPQELDRAGIEQVIKDFVAAAKRAVKAGFEIIEIHSAHGYLLHSFLSPLTNKRKDSYGGSLENRLRLHFDLVTEIRKVIPDKMPLFMRISATDWVEGGWDIEESISLARTMRSLGVDLIDASTGGIVPHATIPVERNYQVPYAAKIRRDTKMLTGAVGLITDPEQANDIITSGSADLVFIGREMLRQPYFALHAQQALNEEPKWPLQYGYAVRRGTR
jgi:2,4-dienoyl-CoA reductase-like NADH-dependent reductase (Old Yellow Enzyme family)